MCGSLFGDNNRNLLGAGDSKCNCNRGWTGLNCNVCKEDATCYGPFGSGDKRTVCEKSGLMASQHFRSCAVLLPDFYANMLAGRRASASIACNNVSFKVNKLKYAKFDCLLQFWLNTNQQFYCSLGGCARKASQDVEYFCPSTSCSCIAGRELCNASLLINLGPMLQQVKSASSIRCLSNSTCIIQERVLNDFFGGGVRLDCTMGECMALEWIPALTSSMIPVIRIMAMVAFTFMVIAALIFLFLLLYLLVLNYAIMSEREIYLEPSFDESENVDSGTKLSFENIQFCSASDQVSILNGIYGVVKPGNILGIIGGSGSGKTTLLDILACKEKNGKLRGEICVNDRMTCRKELKRIYGFVEQDDVLMGSLTVKETLIYTAFLRLPSSMSKEQKQHRVFQTMRDLGLEHLADRFVGMPGRRGISGGEKRRLTIAQELISRPRILFLDEPTSGLDSFTALSLMRSLFRLSRTYKTTIVLTIHQPRSNIFNMLDYVILLGYGYQLYFGTSSAAQDYFADLGYSCPDGYNMGDFMLDIAAKSVDPNPFGNISQQYKQAFMQECDAESENQTSVNEIHYRTIQLKDKFFESENFLALQNELSKPVPEEIVGEAPIEVHDRVVHFCILSCRTLTNIIRNPYLLASHWIVSALIGLFCGLLFWRVTNDMAGVQNRLGCLFFTCAFFAFSSMTSLEFFSTEKAIFLRERASGFYGPFAFYLSKVLFDIFPLRIVPPLLYGSIIYRMAGFYGAWQSFFKFIFALVMFNLASSAICLLIGILIGQLGVANLTASIFILISMLFGGFLMNKETMLSVLRWVKYLSIFNYAYEAMIVNELVHVVLRDKSMVDIRIPGSIILRQFGFDTSGYNFDLCMLSVIFAVIIIAGYVMLHAFVREIK